MTSSATPEVTQDVPVINWEVFAVDKHGFKHFFYVQAWTRDDAVFRAGLVAATMPYFSESASRVVDVGPKPDALPEFIHSRSPQ